ncbi:hypothetical protein [Mesorhizobium sp. B2-1-5]|uniref:hypothetical protein n=1 Tax=Mesorhizobium sp. B2-1-5 TaxID=2589969 RepID=UPI00112BDBA4|nr:hypothetical protein [Mesorhizobium sp. B2-1-5]TPM98481.1 hypothetical protein FJ966_10450 [Mesorhizobium sp. B2-1-5]
MHAAIRAGQVDETPTQDPFEAANDNIAELQQPKTTAMSAPQILAWLMTNGHISEDERDAGGHVIKLASIARSKLTSPAVRNHGQDGRSQMEDGRSSAPYDPRGARCLRLGDPL